MPYALCPMRYMSYMSYILYPMSYVVGLGGGRGRVGDVPAEDVIGEERKGGLVSRGYNVAGT
jgi:hypothetical protein